MQLTTTLAIAIALFMLVPTSVSALTHEELVGTANVSSLITWEQRPTTMNLEYINYNFNVYTYRPHSLNESLGYEQIQTLFTGRVVTTYAYLCLQRFPFQTCYNSLIMSPTPYRFEGYYVIPVLYQYQQFYDAEYERLEDYQQDSRDIITLRTYEEALLPFTQVTFGG
jgi:hypothetical protein